MINYEIKEEDLKKAIVYIKQNGTASTKVQSILKESQWGELHMSHKQKYCVIIHFYSRLRKEAVK